MPRRIARPLEKGRSTCPLRQARRFALGHAALAAHFLLLLSAGWLAVQPSTAVAQGHFDGLDFDAVEIKAIPVNGPIHMLTGAGGNIAVSVGDDGVLIVDDQFLPLAERIQAAIDALGGGRPKFVLNTHYHGDHVGGNPHFGQAGAIIAHDNVRVRLLGNQDLPAAALPIITFRESLSVHFNGDEIRVLHLPAGHTDGDSVVWFRNANVVHLGDLLFNGSFPFIDLAAGGTVAGSIANLEAVLEWAAPDIRVIPGHGPLDGLDAVRATLRMLRDTSQWVAAALAQGTSLDDIIAEGLGPDYADWGSGFINEESWIRTLAADLQAAAE